MIDVKCNYKNKQKNLLCRLCNQHEETQSHVLTECTENKIEESHKISIENIFNNNDNASLKEIAVIINSILESIEDIDSAQP